MPDFLLLADPELAERNMEHHMDTEIEAIFAPLKATLEAQPHGASDLVELIGSFAMDSGTVAQALAFHARDVIRESRDPIAYPALIAEIYRRAFFDRDYAARYGTTEMLDRGPHALQDFVNYLTTSFKMDESQLAAGSLLDAPGRMQ
jgi:hypothetical protein